MGGRSSGLGFRHGLPLGVGRSITGPVYDERLGHLGLGSGYVQKVVTSGNDPGAGVSSENDYLCGHRMASASALKMLGQPFGDRRTHFWTPEADRQRNLKLLITRAAATKHNQLILCLFLAPTILVTTFYTYPQVTRGSAADWAIPSACLKSAGPTSVARSPSGAGQVQTQEGGRRRNRRCRAALKREIAPVRDHNCS
jgi:hypothetical protein